MMAALNMLGSAACAGCAVLYYANGGHEWAAVYTALSVLNGLCALRGGRS